MRVSGQLKDIALKQTAEFEAAIIVSFAPSLATLNGRPAALWAHQAHLNLPHMSVVRVRGMMSTTESARGECKSPQMWLPDSPPRKIRELNKQRG